MSKFSIKFPNFLVLSSDLLLLLKDVSNSLLLSSIRLAFSCCLEIRLWLRLTKIVFFEEFHPEWLPVFIQDFSCSFRYLIEIFVVLLHFNQLFSALPRLLRNNINNFFKLLLWDSNERFGFNIVHEFIEVIHDFIFELLKLFNLLIDVIQTALSIVT